MQDPSPASREEPLLLQPLDVRTRALLAAVALSAADRQVTAAALARSGRYERSSASRHHGDYIRTLVHEAQALTRWLLGTEASEMSRAELYHELQRRDADIADLRRSARQALDDLDQVVTYARGLHEELKRLRDEETAERAAKVRPLRPVTKRGDDDAS